MKGIDVSTHQGNVNWSAVADDGVQFAMIKATQGRGEGVLTRLLRRFKDSKFDHNITEAYKSGIACGVYHYFTAKNVKEAEEEAHYFCDIIQPYKDMISLWAAVDVESDMYLGGIAKYGLAKNVVRFMKVVEQRGYNSMLYTNPNYLRYKFPQGAFDTENIWLAHYGVTKPMQVPHMRIWQYGEMAVNGIKKPCDANIGYFDEAICAIAKLAKMGVINTPLYWWQHYKDIDYIDELLVKASEAVMYTTTLPTPTFEKALKMLQKAGVINTPEYWRKNAHKVKYLPELIIKLGDAVGG